MAVVAYSLWGLLPIYWKLLGAVPAIEVLTHRIVWSLGFIAVLLFARRGWRRTLGFLRDRETRGAMLLSPALIATNWFIFIWAVSADRVTEASLGYYINPLLNVALARVFLGERLRPLQGVAVALAAIGVVTLTVMGIEQTRIQNPRLFGKRGLQAKRPHHTTTGGTARGH